MSVKTRSFMQLFCKEFEEMFDNDWGGFATAYQSSIAKFSLAHYLKHSLKERLA